MTQIQIIYDLISKSNGPLTVLEISEKTGIYYNSVNKCIRDLWYDNQITQGPLRGWGCCAQ